MAFVAKLGEQSYNVEIEESSKGVYRVAVDGNEFVVDGKKTGARIFRSLSVPALSRSRSTTARMNTGC
jgi:hypothetical protein